METNISCKHYIVVEDWMIEKMHLFPKEVFIFANLYAYTKGKYGMFIGTISQLAALSYSSEGQVCETLKRLIKDDYVIKGKCSINERNMKYYQVNMNKIESLFFAPKNSVSENSVSENSVSEEKNSVSEEKIHSLNTYNNNIYNNNKEKEKKLFYNAHAQDFQTDYKPYLDFVNYVLEHIGRVDDYFPDHFINEKEYRYLERKYTPFDLASKVLAYANKKDTYKGKVGNNFFVTMKQWLEKDAMEGKIKTSKG